VLLTFLLPPPVAHASDPESIQPVSAIHGLAAPPVWSGAPGPSRPPLVGYRTRELLLGFGAAAILSARIQDDDRMASALGTPALAPWMNFGNAYGNGLYLGLGAAAAMIGGRIVGYGSLAGAGDEMARSLLLSTAAVWALKLTFPEKRPNGAPYSFPSGHTTDAFCVVPVIFKHWGWRAGVPAAALAVTTALGRMEARKHHLADVVFGAGLGLAIGSEVAGDGRLGRALRHVSVTPHSLGLTWKL
jgi:membrane-associated phospholipid phosphatase